MAILRVDVVHVFAISFLSVLFCFVLLLLAVDSKTLKNHVAVAIFLYVVIQLLFLIWGKMILKNNKIKNLSKF